MPSPNMAWAKEMLGKRIKQRIAEDHKLTEGASYACQALILKNLRDPDSADFISGVNPNNVKKLGRSKYEVLSQVRANNGFGGKTVSIFRCRLSYADGNWYGASLKEFN